jgi:hypothetical protein
MTEPLREMPPASIHDAPVTMPLQAVGRTLAVAIGVGLFLSFVGAFGTDNVPFLPRSLYMIAIAAGGAALGMGTYSLATRIPLVSRHLWMTGFAGGILMTPPMGAYVWLVSSWLEKTGPKSEELLGYIAYSSVICVVSSLVAAFLHRPRVVVVQAPPVPAVAVRFLERLPLKLRGAEIWAVEAEDHYLRLHTSRGQDLILMRLADAVEELAGIEGTQVHRSWWVARDAISDARRGDGRATLVLKDGSEVPVSRTYAKIIRQLGWI